MIQNLHIGAKQLNRDRTIEVGVEREVEHTHTSFSQLFQDFEMGEGFTDHGRAFD